MLRHVQSGRCTGRLGSAGGSIGLRDAGGSRLLEGQHTKRCAAGRCGRLEFHAHGLVQEGDISHNALVVVIAIQSQRGGSSEAAETHIIISERRVGRRDDHNIPLSHRIYENTASTGRRSNEGHQAVPTWDERCVPGDMEVGRDKRILSGLRDCTLWRYGLPRSAFGRI